VPQKPADAAPEARSGIQVIERMMKLLDVLSYHPDPVSLKQLALETGLHPSTAHRILAAMAASGFRRARRGRAATGSASACWNWVTWSSRASASVPGGDAADAAPAPADSAKA
jgi:hypothetical protein